jgi:hypothetical protein
MPFPIGLTRNDATEVARRMNNALKVAYDRATDWRVEVAAGSLNSFTTRETYQALALARQTTVSGLSVAGLAEAYRRMYPTLPVDFNPSTAWDEAETPVSALLAFVRNNWPHRDASGRPVFEAADPVSGELKPLSVAINAGTRTALLSRIDAVLAAFN